MPRGFHRAPFGPLEKGVITVITPELFFVSRVRRAYFTMFFGGVRRRADPVSRDKKGDGELQANPAPSQLG